MWTRRTAREPAPSGRRRPWRFAVALILALACAAPPALAAESEAEQAILTLRANGVPRGEFTMLKQADGDFWIAAADLPRIGVNPGPAPRHEWNGTPFYSLRELGASLTYDEAELALRADFPAASLGGTRIDVSSRPPPAPVTSVNSLLLSYRLSMRPAVQGVPTATTLDTEANAHWGPLLLRQEARLTSDAAGRRATRGVSQAIWESPARALRATAGDVLSSAGAFGSTITGAGLLVAKRYDMAPDVVTQPTATIRTQAALPAQVEVSVDGSTVYRGSVPPGPVTLTNVISYGGTRNVRVVVTDSSGHREVYDQPFLFADNVLAQGLHDYSYFIGRRSELGADNGFAYKEAAWQGFHRYGLTDWLTVSAGGEGNRDFANAGAGLTLRSDRLGLASLEALTSNDLHKRRTARGWAARYAYYLPSASILLGHRRFDRGFRTFTTTDQAPYLLDESSLAASLRLGRWIVSGEVSRSRTPLEVRNTRALRLSTSIGRNITLGAEFLRFNTNDQREWSANVFVRAELEKDHWVRSSARTGSNDRALEVEAGKQVPQGEGFGWRAGLVASQPTTPGGAPTQVGHLYAAWNARPATVEFFGSSALGQGGSQFAEIDVSGSVVAIGGYVGLARRINDGFALARLGVPQKGIEVSVNNQVQGHTDASGQLLIPQVSAYIQQRVSVNEHELGMQYDIAEKVRTIAVPTKGGTIVDFGARRIRAAAGMAWIVRGAARTPVASRSWPLSSAVGRELRIETSRAGDFYLEDVPPGHYEGTLQVEGRRYACRLEVPDFSEAVHELKEGVLCE